MLSNARFSFSFNISKDRKDSFPFNNILRRFPVFATSAEEMRGGCGVWSTGKSGDVPMPDDPELWVESCPVREVRGALVPFSARQKPTP